MSTNTELARRFDRMAALLELLGENRFRAIAYHKASRALSEQTRDVCELADDIAKLTALEGIGKGLAEKIIEYCQTGHITELDELLDKVPPGVLTLLEIPGLGPKSVANLWKKANVTSLEDLKKKLETDELQDLPRLGKKTLENLARSIAFAESAGERVLIHKAMAVAEAVVAELSELPNVTRCDYAGSLRRGSETIGDVDILAACADPKKQAAAISLAFQKMANVNDVLLAGEKKTSVRTIDNLQIDLRIVDEQRYGAALLYFTGSKAHNVALRERAIRAHYKLNEYGLFKSAEPDTEPPAPEAEPVAAGTEAAIYRKLKLAYIAPELREDRGEIDAAAHNKLPKLLELGDIRCELHAHTTASDGHWSIEELAIAARDRGFHTIAVTDHSQSSAIANGLTVPRLLQHIKAIREAAKHVDNITILAGSEVDILADGRLDYPDDVLAQLDIVVASPHASLKQEPAKATARLLRAIENPYVHILGHPTGRLVNRREGLKPDMHRIIEAAAETGTALEINANPHRLDLRDTHAHAAIQAGCKLAINTDAHGPPDMDHLRYGVLTARRAWATKADVINTFTPAALKKWLK
ncbi:MAG: DNA polymerase/3'-5' exonuclease PolX [Phycisphaeraceae bacterium]